MKWSNRIALAFLCTVALASANAYAGAGDTPSGDPPHGVAFQSDAKGTKLSGVISIELTEVNTGDFTASAARGILRLRQGGQIATFYSQVDDTSNCSHTDVPDENDCVRWEFAFEIEQIEEALLASLVGGPDGILATFFGEECGANGDACSLVVTPKLIDESAEVIADVGAGRSLFLVADVTLAVH
jgi:hypothetical protein